MFPLIGDDLHGATNIASLHAVDPRQRGDAVRSDQIDLRLSVAEHMDMGRLVVVREYDEAQPASAMNRNHSSR